jgi:hypothetical protein
MTKNSEERALWAMATLREDSCGESSYILMCFKKEKKE